MKGSLIQSCKHAPRGGTAPSFRQSASQWPPPQPPVCIQQTRRCMYECRKHSLSVTMACFGLCRLWAQHGTCTNTQTHFMPLPCPHIRPLPNISLNVILDWTNTLKDLANTLHAFALSSYSPLTWHLIERNLGLDKHAQRSSKYTSCLCPALMFAPRLTSHWT